MYEKWQSALFDKLIDDLLQKINQNQITWFQLNLILKQGCIKYRSLSEQLKFKKYFQQYSSITKLNLKKLLLLTQTLITNNKRYYIIKMKQSIQSLQHKPIKCFNWWKQWMTKKYGADLKWFDVVCMQKDCFKIKVFDFKRNLALIIKNTQHQKCYNTIASFFPKTQKNQIQFGIFLNTIKVSHRSKYNDSKSKYGDNLTSKKQLSKLSNSKSLMSKSRLSYKQNSKQKLQQNMIKTSQNFYISEWTFQNQDKQERQRKQAHNYVRGRIIKNKNLIRSISTHYYSVPIKQMAEKQNKKQRYHRTWTLDKN